MNKNLFMVVLMICISVYWYLIAAPSIAANPKLMSHIDLGNNDAVAFVGDRITHQCLSTQYFEDYYTRYPKTHIRFYNAGVGGSRTSDELARFIEDVVSVKPKYVTVLLGMNDGSYKRHNLATFQTYEKEMTSILEKISALGARPILTTPTLFDVRAQRNAIANGLQAEDRIRCNFLANSLPWVVPEDARLGFQLVEAGSTLSLNPYALTT